MRSLEKTVCSGCGQGIGSHFFEALVSGPGFSEGSHCTALTGLMWTLLCFRRQGPRFETKCPRSDIYRPADVHAELFLEDLLSTASGLCL